MSSFRPDSYALAGVLAFMLCLSAANAEEPLVFVSMPDTAMSDWFLEEDLPADVSRSADEIFGSVAALAPTFVLMDGDLGAQHWWKPEFQACAPEADLQGVVAACADQAWGGLSAYLSAVGLENLHVAMGDHEIGGNDWPLGPHSDAVPFFKAAFAKHFTRKPEGESRYDGDIGGVPMRPVGTPYEHTSHAFQAGNLLVVSVDEYQQIDPAQVLGPRGSVLISVNAADGHLQWLDALLGAARQDPGISHIIVQGHVPVISPVRAFASSMNFMDEYDDSAFWQVLRKHAVDLYFAGDVHETTVTRDKASNLLQVTHGAGFRGNMGFLVVRVYGDRIELEQRSRHEDPGGGVSFVPESTLLLDKSSGTPRYSFTGEALKPIDPAGLQVHYSFDDDAAGLAKNSGGFGHRYDSRKVNVKRVAAGKLGAAAYFRHADRSRLLSTGITPVAGDRARTVAMWIKKPSDRPGYLYPSGQFWKNDYGLFRFFVGSGQLGLEVGVGKRVMAAQGDVQVNDGMWHHVAVTFPGRGATLDDVRFYIDGLAYLPEGENPETIFTEAEVNSMMVGGTPSPRMMPGWTGGIDDFAIWSSAHTAPMVAAMVSCANQLGYDAGEMESLFRLYRDGQGQASVKGVTWEYDAAVGGEAGVCAQDGDSGRLTLALDGEGRGVAVRVADDPTDPTDPTDPVVPADPVSP